MRIDNTSAVVLNTWSSEQAEPLAYLFQVWNWHLYHNIHEKQVKSNKAICLHQSAQSATN